jgi:serine/threonine-protein kinase
MGEVYRARDTRLNRDVAVKVLSTAFAADLDRQRRFEEEARAVAALNHPHICQIYDVGPGYLVLEYVAGTPLRGPLAADEAVRLALQIAGALETAHERGILHRDLKPANILVTGGRDAHLGRAVVVGRSGRSSDPPTAKLLDFGLAKSMDAPEGGPADPTRTLAGTIVGTAAYMSPEQAQGRPLDARSDIFSFGAVLYEWISGARAFTGDTTVDVVSAVLRDDPAPLQAPVALERVVRTCLQKDPAKRFQSMAELRAELEQLAVMANNRQPSIAVLPFENMSGDKENEYFSDGLAEEIINALTRISGLKVIARTSAFAFKGKHEDVRRIAEVLGVTTVLEGSVRKAGSRVRVTAQLITAADGTHLWSERYDREMIDVFAIQDEIAAAITEALQIKLATTSARQRYKPTLPAYEALLKGRQFILSHAVESQAPAQVWLERAIALDPGYAEPHANLGLSYFLLSTMGMRALRETMPLIRTEANEALRLEPAEPDPHYLLGAVAVAYEYDWKKAAAHFAIAMAGTSVSAEAHWAYASLYLQPLGHFKEAVLEMERAVERDPLNGFWRGVLASHLTHAEQFDRAIEQAQEAMRIDATHLVPYTTLGEAYAARGRWPEVIQILEQGRRVSADFALNTGILAGALIRTGERTRAEALIFEMGETPRPLVGRALYHVLCSELDLAADWYARAIEQRDPFALVLANVPMLRPLRQTSRWPQLAKMMNLPDSRT